MYLKITPLAALKDNLIWILSLEGTEDRLVTIVDPGVAAPVLEYLQQHDLSLEFILLTHHHADHSAGIAELLTKFPKAKVIAHPQSPYVHLPLEDKGFFHLFAGKILAQALFIPGHTLDHTAFLIEDHLFCGDTLFAAGCGRLFEGSYKQLWHSLETLKVLPPNTLVYCGHEYTLANLRFAKVVEPTSTAIAQRILETQQRLNNTGCSLPSSIALEKLTNPFLRCDNNEVQASVRTQGLLKEPTPLGVLTGLRQWKDRFK